MKNTKLIIKTKSKIYPIYFGNNVLNKTALLIKKNLLGVKKICIISDNKLPKLLLKKLTKSLKKYDLKIYKLSSNENPFGPSSNAIAEYEKVSNDLGLYPDSSNAALKLAISSKYSIDSDRIVCGCGSDEILHLLARVYLDEGNQ